MTVPSRGTTPGSPAEDRDAAVAEESGEVAESGSPAAPGELPGTAGDGAADTPGSAGDGAADGAEAVGSEAAPGDGTPVDGEAADAVDGAADGAPAAGGTEAAQPSEAEAEIAAQRELRERIARRKAEKEGPIAAGAKLSGQAAHLLAAVRAMENGEPAPARPVAPAPPPAAVAAAVPPQHRPREPAPARIAGGSSVTAPEAVVAAVGAVLAEGGAPRTLAPRVAASLGERAGDALRDDPWLLLSVPGVRPEQADGFARALLGDGCGPGDERRAAALVGWLLERAAGQGHTALAFPEVRAALAERSVPDPDEALRHAIAEGVVLVFQDGVPEAAGEPDDEAADASADGAAEDGPAVPVLLGLDRYALAEESLADGLARLVKTAQGAAHGSAQGSWEEAAEGAPSPSAAELVRAVAGHGLVIHTGGEAARAEPVALVESARALGLRPVLAAHSENGRRRLGAGAVTVAGLLSGAEGPGRDTDGALALDLLVVLDAPQLDVETAAELVEALPDGARLVLGGDPGVLWSAGAGRVFGDLLAARVCPRIASRTPDPGPIGELVSGIGIGELSQVGAPGKEVVIVPVRDAGEAVHRTVQLVADSVPRVIGVPSGQTQVITVGHGGAAGTRVLNAALKERLNPGPGRFGGFDPDDRIAYVPAPGRALTGSVVSADAEGLRLDCDGVPVVVPRELVDSVVRHGWALTAHQAAGMRWPAAVVVLPGDAAPGLSRPWVYTAFGRGERHLSVVHGVDQALPRAVSDVPAADRTTRLRPLLEGLLTPVP
ncbi:DNA helicase RecD [Streptomyces sp. NBC_01498]|uniref:helix-hairpin-helix domain-containing protein n=1 Tax=Streptomyces sp. NBC_01498 TaxID=2975870 RepID=UPI002E7B2CC9|nr:helix-hairpin-helix domain-containing protein [Streptomyces sp. NBC_01498]WTL27691.1 DNA helicase RecD [Streptomyces sp. NBC_01498]